MDFHTLTPYIHLAMRSVLPAEWQLRRRVIYDYEVVLLESGCWELTVEDTVYRCEPGSVILLRPGSPHSIRSLSTEPIVQPHIHFDLFYDGISAQIPVSFKDVPAMTPQEREQIRPDLLPTCEPVLRIPDPAEFRRLLLAAVDCFDREQNSLECRALLLRVLAYIIRYNIESPVVRTDKSSRRMADIRAYIDGNAANAVTLPLLSRQFNYHASYIDRCFKATYGIPVIRYYHELRLRAAQELLEGGMSVTAVAEELHFSSVYAFSRFFRQHMGRPPREFRGT